MTARVLAVSAIEARKRWDELVACARSAVKSPGRNERASLMGAVIRTGARSPFPIEGASPAEAGHALRILSKAYAETTLEDRLYAIGEALTAVALCVDRLLDEPATAHAREINRRFGERED